MILSASRRTDIPCWYSDWFINRLKEGYVLTRNPMNHAQLSRIPLTPSVVDCIVFWTKDAQNLMPYLDTIGGMGYKYYFQFTLTPYDRLLEPNLRDKAEIENTFIALSKRIGKERLFWRYDPIVLNEGLTVEYHKEQFARLCEKLSPYTKSVTISFVDLYAKLKTPRISEITADEMEELAVFISAATKSWGLEPKACCEKTDLTKYGIASASCIDKAVLEKVCACPLDISRDMNQRGGCGCMESIDIGAYNTCPNGCVYCYANDSAATTERRYKAHNPDSALLVGTAMTGEKITERNVKSCKVEQLSLL